MKARMFRASGTGRRMQRIAKAVCVEWAWRKFGDGLALTVGLVLCATTASAQSTICTGKPLIVIFSPGVCSCSKCDGTETLGTRAHPIADSICVVSPNACVGQPSWLCTPGDSRSCNCNGHQTCARTPSASAPTGSNWGPCDTPAITCSGSIVGECRIGVPSCDTTTTPPDPLLPRASEARGGGLRRQGPRLRRQG